MTRMVTYAELSAAAGERQRLAIRRAPKANYALWCYCSWCPWSALSTPHFRRYSTDPCPDPGRYVTNLSAESGT